MEIVIFPKQVDFASLSGGFLISLLFGMFVNVLTPNMMFVALAFVLSIGLISVISYNCWLNQRIDLYLRLDHETNEVVVQESNRENWSQSQVFLVSRRSKMNTLGVWLYLIAKDGDSASKSLDASNTIDLKKLFIGRWQTDKRGISALSRHLLWYVTPI